MTIREILWHLWSDCLKRGEFLQCFHLIYIFYKENFTTFHSKARNFLPCCCKLSRHPYQRDWSKRTCFLVGFVYDTKWLERCVSWQEYWQQLNNHCLVLLSTKGKQEVFVKAWSNLFLKQITRSVLKINPTGKGRKTTGFYPCWLPVGKTRDKFSRHFLGRDPRGKILHAVKNAQRECCHHRSPRQPCPLVLFDFHRTICGTNLTRKGEATEKAEVVGPIPRSPLRYALLSSSPSNCQ